MYKNQKGFNLIEIMISVVILSIGILGLVASQTRSVNITADAVKRNIAITLVNELIDIMRTYPTQVYTVTSPTPRDLNPQSMFMKNLGDNFSPVTYRHCTTATVAVDRDFACWQVRLLTTLIGASAENTASNPNDNTFTNRIQDRLIICVSNEDQNGCEAKRANQNLIYIQIGWQASENICFDRNNGNAPTRECTYTTTVRI